MALVDDDADVDGQSSGELILLTPPGEAVSVQ